MIRNYLVVSVIGVLLFMAGCDTTNSDNNTKQVNAVFTITNAASKNEVRVFTRADDGSLSLLGSFDTGGLGSGPPANFPEDPFGSQDAVILSPDGQFLFVVDAGSNEVSSFSVASDAQLSLISTVSSGGEFPVSLTFNNDLLYVLNAKGTGGNISGLRVGDDGTLSPLDGSTQPLSGVDTPLPGNAVAPAEVQFSPDGDFLTVTEKATNLIDVYTVGSDGTPSPPNTQQSLTPTPFGTSFDNNGFYIVSETNAIGPRIGKPDSSSVSTYTISADGTLKPVTRSLVTNQTAACWIAVTNDNRYVYDTNTSAGTITGFSLGSDGTLAPLNAGDGLTADLGSESVLLDLAISDNYMYVLSAGNGEINGFQIEDDGSLTPLPNATVGGLPAASVEGLAAINN